MEIRQPLAISVDIIAMAPDPLGGDAEDNADVGSAGAGIGGVVADGEAVTPAMADAPLPPPSDEPATAADGAAVPSSPPPADPVGTPSADDMPETLTALPAAVPPALPRQRLAIDKSTVAAATTAHRQATQRRDVRRTSKPSTAPAALSPPSTPGGSGGDLGAPMAGADPGAGAAAARSGPRFQAGAPGNPLPDYPESARRWGYQGRVFLAVHVSADGRPLSVDVASSSGHSILDRSALEAVRRWRFRPAVGQAGNGVALVNVPIAFRLKD
jgi:protein TonB